MDNLLNYILEKTNNATISYSDSQCKKDGNPTNECDYVKRLTQCLKMYAHLDIVNDSKHQSQFTEHMNDGYKQFLDDYIHLISNHSHQLEQINSSLDPCDITKCDVTSRRHVQSTDHLMEMKDDEDNLLKFYSRTIDSLHFYLHHLFDVGLRVRANTINDEPALSTESEFLRVCAAVKAGREVTKSFNRFPSQSKFNFCISPKGMKLSC